MSEDVIKKTRGAIVVSSAGTALGTTSIIDTSAWEFMQLTSIHGGTGGSRLTSVYVNGGTQDGTAATTFPNAIFVGSGVSDQAGAGTPVWICGSLTHQAIITYGTSTNSSFSLACKMFDL